METLTLVIVLLLLCERIVFCAERVMRKPDKHFAQSASAEGERDDRSREIDEGFDNIMSYSVRGSDGFGGGQV